MKKNGVITGLLFVVLLAFVFQTEVGGFFASVREKAQEAVNADTAALAQKENLPKLNEQEDITTKDKDAIGDVVAKGIGKENIAKAPPVPGDKEASKDQTEPTAAPITYKEVSLFYVDEGKGEMAVEKRSVINQIGVAKTTMDELLTGPTEASLKSYIPADAEVLGINITKDGLCTVDFSPEIQKAKLNSAEERYVLESIVGTLGQFDSVKAVQIKINGATAQSLTGHWDISQPLSVNDM
ncbi:MAG: GerMN domain-containing protein [Clostridiales bacterium]